MRRSYRLLAALDGVEVEVGEDDDDEEHDVGDGGRLAGAEELEGHAVDVDGDGFGSGAGTAFGDDVDEVEQFEGFDGPEEDRQQEQAFDVWESDGRKSSPPGSAVDLGGLVEIFRHAYQTR